MLNKNAFTLAELLAVIVIIALVGTITTPIMLNVINTSKENAFKDDAIALVRTSQNYHAAQSIAKTVNLPILITFENKKETNTYFNNSENICQTSNQRMLEYAGENPDSGGLFIDRNGDVTLAVYNDEINKCAKKNPNEKTIIIDNTEKENCIIKNTSDELKSCINN